MNKLAVALIALLFVFAPTAATLGARNRGDERTNGKMVVDEANKAVYAEKEAATPIYGKFEWYAWKFEIDPSIDGRQVYFKIDLAKEYKAKDFKVLFRFTRKLGNGEYASYWHVVTCTVG